VTGTVIVQDTQRPARFADVVLQSVPETTGNVVRTGSYFGGERQGRTDAEGSFTLTGVAPGDYYAIAGGPGFVPEQQLLQAQVSAGADPADLMARLPIVHVAANSVSNVVVTVQRGGVITGKLLWEDGSPAAGIYVSADLNLTTSAQLTKSASVIRVASAGNRGNSAPTDDRGIFRIAGVATGDYVVVATIQTRGLFDASGPRRPEEMVYIREYAPGTFHRASAKPINVRAGEERDDVRMVIDLRGLHTVAGHASSASEGANVASGTVTLTDPTDTGLRLRGSIQPDGSFAVRYVPPGSYTLQISGASSQANNGYGGRGRGGSSSGGTSFQPFSAAVTVTDVDLTGVAAMLTPVQSTP
jgi:septal ring-binding cell division protein DamX